MWDSYLYKKNVWYFRYIELGRRNLNLDSLYKGDLMMPIKYKSFGIHIDKLGVTHDINLLDIKFKRSQGLTKGNPIISLNYKYFDMHRII